MDYLTVHDLAGRYGVSRPHIHHLIDRGQLRALRLGRLLRIPLDAVTEFERSNTSGPGVNAEGDKGVKGS